MWLDSLRFPLANQIMCPRIYLFLVPQAQSAKRNKLLWGRKWFKEQNARLRSMNCKSRMLCKAEIARKRLKIGKQIAQTLKKF